MADFTLEITASANYEGIAPTLEILLDGVVVSAELVTAQTGSGSMVFSYNLSTTGYLPSSLQFRFHDGESETKRSITFEQVKINDTVVVTKAVNNKGVIKTNTPDDHVGHDQSVALDLKDNDTQEAFDTASAFSDDANMWDPEEGPSSSDLVVQTDSGTNGGDRISGVLLNNDVILGMDGDDLIRGEQGNDVIYGGQGNDRVVGNAGNDLLMGDEGNDSVEGKEGDDQLYGNDGDDRVYGGDGDDLLSGNDGNDRLYGDAGNDTIYGGNGDDIIYDLSGNATIYGGADQDQIYTGDGDDVIDGGDGNDKIEAGNGNNTIYGGEGRDKIYGGDDADTIHGENGSDIIAGNGGNDTVFGGKGNDKIYGHDGNDTLNGEVGHDQIYAGDGNDIIDGGEDNDVLVGGMGNDTINGGDGNDALYSFDQNAVPGGLLSTQILNGDPVAYWRLDDAGGTANNLGTGTGIDGSYQGGVATGQAALYTTGTGSANFDGINDYISIPNSALINTASVTARTVELVFNADTVSGRHVLYEEGGATNSLLIYIDNGNIHFSARDSGEWGPFSISSSINAGQTYHAALVLDTAGDGTIRGFLNGSGVGSGTTATNLDSHSGAIAIGGVDNDTYFHDGAFNGDGHYFDGTISDVAIYNSALSQDELLSHARSLSLESDPNTNDGDDVLRGGAGDDILYASGGSDTLYGDADNDELYGSASSNILYGGSGDDELYADGYEIKSIDPILGVSELAAKIIIDSPDAFWALNDTGGSTADNWGTGGASIDGTYSGGVTLGASALYDGGDLSADFDGVDDIVFIPDTDSINTSTYTEKTVELVFNADTTASRQVLYEEGATVHGMTIYIDSGNLYITGEHDSQWADANINAAITANQTYHVAFVFDQANDSFTGYLDGVNIGSVSVNGQIFPSHSGDISIGGAADGVQFHDGESGSGGYYFDGQISDVAVYTAALSSDDILQHANIVTGAGGTGGVTAPDDYLYGGDGADDLYGGNGRDIFVFEAASAFNDVDQIYEFGYYDHDALDISDLLSGFTAGVSDINDFVQTTKVGAHTMVSVDANGAAGGANFVDIARINGLDGLTADILYDNSSLIV